MHAILIIAKKGLACRGSGENFGSKCNGNFITKLELISETDVKLK